MRKFVSLLLLLNAFTPSAAHAAQYELADEVTAYNQGDYRQVIGVGQLLASQDPKNAVVHYYLASAYNRLGELPEAQREYTICEQLAKDLQTKAYCEQALALLRNQNSKDAEPVATSRPFVPYLGNVIVADRSSRLIAEAKNTILQQQEDMNNQAVETAERRIENIEQQASRDIAAVPKYSYLFRLPNPDYDSMVSKINRDSDDKIARIRDSLADNQRAIKQFSQHKLEELASTVEATQSQRSEGITSLQLAPGPAQVYIKDYLHFDVAPPPAFPDSAIPGMKNELKQVSNSQSQG